MADFVKRTNLRYFLKPISFQRLVSKIARQRERKIGMGYQTLKFRVIYPILGIEHNAIPKT